ncbi:MAG: tetratricopeptide repeat protein [Cyanobacteria bacterium P01_A01_bin.40]
MEQDDLSLSDAQKVIEIAPHIIDSYFIMGANHEVRNNYDEAITVYNLAAKIEPDAAVVYYKLAKAYSYLENYLQVEKNVSEQ